MVFTTTSSARHRFAAGATRGRKFGGRENGGGKAGEGEGWRHGEYFIYEYFPTLTHCSTNKRKSFSRSEDGCTLIKLRTTQETLHLKILKLLKDKLKNI